MILDLLLSGDDKSKITTAGRPGQRTE
jgi:hypothetical protein